MICWKLSWSFSFFFFNDTATTEIYTLSLHDPLPISSASEPLVIHIFEPFSTQSPPRFLAWVFMLAGSDPPCGSGRPKQPMSSPRATGGRHRFFCSSEPKAQIGSMHRGDCTETQLPMPEAPRSSS